MILDMFSLKGKVALVTGGAGNFGTEITAALGESGAKVYIASRNMEALEASAAVHRSKGLDVTAVQLDLGSEESILGLKQEIMSRDGALDILVNNANVKTMKGWDDPAGNFVESMKINAGGLFVITRAFGDEMAKRGKGSIINIASISGMTAPDWRLYYEELGWTGFLPDYGFHKAGMINFTRFTAAYYGPYNVRCNSISPGGLKSQQTQDEYFRRYKDNLMLPRMLDSSDLKGAVVYLASEASAFVTGVNLPIDGGYTAK